MKKIGFYTLLIIAVVMGACSKDNSADVKSLLATIPSSSSMVCVMDINSLHEKESAKGDGEELNCNDVLDFLISNKNDREWMDLLSSGKAGIEPSVLALFSDGYVVCLTGVISNTKDFEASVAKTTGAEFVDKKGVKTCRNIAYKDDRFWLVLSGRPEVDAVEINGYMSLAESQSVLSRKEVTDILTGFDHDILGWADIAGIMTIGDMDFQKRAMLKLGLETIFDDAKSVIFSADFKKGELECLARLLNSKWKDAKCLLNLGKIDEQTILKIAGTADMVIAADMPAKMISDLTERTSGSPSMINIMLQSMKGVDGTMAIAFSNDMQSFRGVVTTDGSDVTSLQQLLGGSRVSTRREGNFVLFSFGEQKGSSTVTKLVSGLKGASLGASMSDEDLTKHGIGNISMTCNQSSGTMDVKWVIKPVGYKAQGE